ncbi:MAG: hypothetical protein ACK5BE_02495 [Alphaproteobacteria bacterium]
MRGGGHNLKPYLWLLNIHGYGDGYIIKFSGGTFVCNKEELAGIIDILDRCRRKSSVAKIAIQKIEQELTASIGQKNEDRDDAKQNPLLSLPDEVLSTLKITTSSGIRQGHAYILSSSKGKIFLKSLYIQDCVNSIIRFFEGLPDEKKSIVRLKITNNILSLLELHDIKESTLESLDQIGIRAVDDRDRSLNFKEEGVKPSPYMSPNSATLTPSKER